MDRPIKI